MPRASWRGFLRLSLVSCPIYLSPATTRTKTIRLHQVRQPALVDVDEDDLPDLGGAAPSVTRLRADNAGADGDESPAATRITLRPQRGPLSSDQPRRLKSYPNLDNFRLSPSKKVILLHLRAYDRRDRA